MSENITKRDDWQKEIEKQMTDPIGFAFFAGRKMMMVVVPS